MANLVRTSASGFKRYSGEYNLLIFVVGLMWFDHYLENKIRRELNKVIRVQKSFDKL